MADDFVQEEDFSATGNIFSSYTHIGYPNYYCLLVSVSGEGL
jgi:hypothetical protein